MFYIKRNIEEFGPYDAQQIKLSFAEGILLKKDLIRHENTTKYISVIEFLQINNLTISQKEEQVQDLLKNIFSIQRVFLNPFKYLKSGFKENSIIYLFLAIVLIPVLALVFSVLPIVTYSIYGVYFAAIWVVALYKTIGTNQVAIKNIILIIMGTIIISTITIYLFQSSFLWRKIEVLIQSENILYKFLGMFFGVAIIEESLKQLFIYVVISRNKFITIIRTAIFYGMISGLTFGIVEGVEYQVSLNKELGADQNYFYNIIRLTSLPFFHAIWAGIGAYFISLSYIMLKFKYTLRVLGLVIPALLHAFYNVFGLNVLGILVIVFSTILLTVYLTKSNFVGKNLNKL
jgi:RsiW-degrading membrane proteinase PrsW (M82 family)